MISKKYRKLFCRLLYINCLLSLINIQKVIALYPEPLPHNYLGISAGFNTISFKNIDYSTLKLFNQFDYKENLKSGFQIFFNYMWNQRDINPVNNLKLDIKLGYYSYQSSINQNVEKLIGLTENLDTISFNVNIRNILKLKGFTITPQLFLRIDPFYSYSRFQIFFGFGPQLMFLTYNSIGGNIEVNTEEKIIKCFENSPFKFDNLGLIKNYNEQNENLRNILFNLLFSIDINLYINNFLYEIKYKYDKYPPINKNQKLESYIIFNLVFNYGLGLTPMIKISEWKTKSYSINFEMKFPFLWNSTYIPRDEEL
jgi:hypothetical protein